MNKKLKPFAIITGVLLGICVIFGAFLITHAFAAGEGMLFSCLQALSYLLMSFCGMYYIFIGCKKSIGGKLLKVFMGLFALCLFIQFFNSDYMRLSSFYVADTALRFAAVSVLWLSQDLGEVKSKCLSGLVLLASFVELIVLYFRPGMDWTHWFSAFIGAVAGIALFLFICFKYADKKARGSK